MVYDWCLQAHHECGVPNPKGRSTLQGFREIRGQWYHGYDHPPWLWHWLAHPWPMIGVILKRMFPFPEVAIISFTSSPTIFFIVIPLGILLGMTGYLLLLRILMTSKLLSSPHCLTWQELNQNDSTKRRVCTDETTQKTRSVGLHEHNNDERK